MYRKVCGLHLAITNGKIRKDFEGWGGGKLHFVNVIEKGVSETQGQRIVIKRMCLPKCKVKLHEIWLIFDPKRFRLQQVIASSFRLDNEFSLQAALLPLNRLYRVIETSSTGKWSDWFLKVWEQSYGNLLSLAFLLFLFRESAGQPAWSEVCISPSFIV